MSKRTVKLELMTGKVSAMKEEPKKITGGGDHTHEIEALVIERAENGYVVRIMEPFNEESLVETVLVFGAKDREELLKEIAKRL